MNPTGAAQLKRDQLSLFIERMIVPEPAVQAVIAIGSTANGLARPDSDIDAIVFLDPFDLYAVPAEFVWHPSDPVFYSIFSTDAAPGGVQLDFIRLDLRQWAAPDFLWPEARCAELASGWIAFDRHGAVAPLIAERTVYPEDIHQARLDEAITWLDQHLGDDGPQTRWASLGPLIAHDRLDAAYHYLVQALFACNRRWRPWRNREMPALLALPWLPADFEPRVWIALYTLSTQYSDYLARVDALRSLADDLFARLIDEGAYGGDIVGEAFVRTHEEPGRAWNMDEWNERHRERSCH
ncbi:MAG: nucleotidyltransferase domain-containing protein [Anaerolineae bacterium]|nr:nucleotidyltransferase domain-containing protein [Anaerolineae bacterium]